MFRTLKANEIDVRIEKAIKQHIEIWHKHHENA